MKASVIIPTFNGGKLLAECAHSLVRQEFKYKWEVIIIDSRSTDDSIGNITKIFSANKIPHQIISIPSEEFQHGASRNLAISQAEGEIVCLLTQDAIPANSQWLNELTKSFFEDEKICGVFGRHIAHEGHPRLISRDLCNHFDYMNTQKVRFISNKETYENNTTLRQFLHFFSNNNSALRKKTWKQLPLPEVNFGEDQTWAQNILEKGYSIAYENNAVVKHSHYYGLLEIYSRAKTESLYYKKYFGYNLSVPWFKVFNKIFHLFASDIKWLKKNKLLDFKEILFSFVTHLGTQLARSHIKLR